MKQQVLRFYFKDEATNFNVDVTNDNNFKSFMYNAKLLEITEADGDNGILKNKECNNCCVIQLFK